MPLKRIRGPARTPEQIADERAVREQFADRPGVAELIERGDIDPERILTGEAFFALFDALIALRRERIRQGVSLEDLAARCGIDPAALSRLETGKNPNPTYETLSRYAGGLGMALGLTVMRADQGRARRGVPR